MNNLVDSESQHNIACCLLTIKCDLGLLYVFTDIEALCFDSVPNRAKYCCIIIEFSAYQAGPGLQRHYNNIAQSWALFPT